MSAEWAQNLPPKVRHCHRRVCWLNGNIKLFNCPRWQWWVLFRLRLFQREKQNFIQWPQNENSEFLFRDVFNTHRIQYESGALNTEFLNIYFFFPSITDRIEEINRYMGSVNLIPIDIQEENFEVEGGKFDLSKLDFDNPGKHKTREQF